MNDCVIKVQNLSKVYRLGEIGTGTLSHDLNRWFAKIRGKEDPYRKLAHVNDRTKEGELGEYVSALSNINFEVFKGEAVGIIGNNGAGKSTILKILSRVTSPTVGEVRIKGRVASLLEVGTGFHPELTGRENVYMNGTIHGMTRCEIKARLDDIIDFAGVARYLDTPVKRYSSGMVVRLGFAVAAFLEAEILIVDEVLAVGDLEFQKRAIGKMEEVSKNRKKTILFVSHNLASISLLCNRGLLLDKGCIIGAGMTDQVIKSYLRSNESVSNLNFEINSEYIESIRLASLDDDQKNSFSMGEDVKIIIGLNESINQSLVHVGFFIIDQFGSKVGAVSTAMKSRRTSIKHHKAEYVFILKRIPLVEGKYYISISLTNKLGGRLEFIERAAAFNILPTDIYNSGAKINSHFGNVFFDFDIIY